MSIVRSIKHWIMAPVPVTYTVPEQTINAIEKHIESCEEQTSVEFRVFIERSLPAAALRENRSDNDRARDLFGLYGVWDTEENNGVLIYLNLSDRAVEILLDRAAARVVSQQDLNQIISDMLPKLAEKNFEKAICDALTKLTELLKDQFPNRPVSDPLPNRPVLL